MSRPFAPRSNSFSSGPRINGKIRAREVRVIGFDGTQLGVLSLADAIREAQKHAVDLVEIAATAVPPVCRIVDFGKFRYEQAKKDKESKKHQHANKVKEVQLSATIDPHDFGVKLAHAVDFLCEDMKVKIALRFRGREMAHTEFGFQVVRKFITDLTPWGHPDSPDVKLQGKSINVMISPLPRAKRAKHPTMTTEQIAAKKKLEPIIHVEPTPSEPEPNHVAPKAPPAAFNNNPFAKLDVSPRKDEPQD
ncbi:MAG: translation initiation factor IF-3 [Verrucomicrobia bacterium]|nr:translation initiation factor IF-3 [Verrucomicrobiota bacterium]